MTPEAQILIQAPTGSAGFRADQITIAWEPHIPPPPPHAADRLESQWNLCRQEAAAKGVTLFNGPITQLLAAHPDPSNPEHLQLTLAPSDYKTFIITRMRDRAWFEQNAPAVMARALGNSALLSHHRHALFGIRSAKVSAYSHRAHLIGGVLERLATPDFPASPAGMISHLLLELSEEAALAPHELEGQPDAPRLLAVAHDHHLGQPEAIWSWPTRIPLDQIAPRLADAEHSGALILEQGPLSPLHQASLTPIARLAFDLWSQASRR